MTTKDTTFSSIFFEAAYIIRRVNRYRWDERNDYMNGPHGWHINLQDKFTLHPVVYRIVHDGVRPIDWHQLLLEWPHVSEEDPMAIAYTRDERKGEDNVQTRTSIGKYLARHWAHVPDHIRRDWGEAYGNHKFELWDTKAKIICGIELGPQSCMKSSYGSIPFSEDSHAELCTWFGGDTNANVPWDNHPYAVYSPEYGWRMAVRLDPGKPAIVLGRGLVNTNHMVFVRTYKRGEYDHSNSGTDERLEAWLVKQGYTRESEWPYNLRLRKIDHPTDHSAPFMVPYLDGGCQNVEDQGRYLTIDCDGDYECTNTDGTPDGNDREAMGDCEDCGDTVYEDDDERIWAGRHEDRLIGGSCGCCSSYVWVMGDSGRGRANRYYVHEDDVLEVGSESYDESNLPDCIKELHDGNYAHEDDCVFVNSEDTYYKLDDVVHCETDQEYYPEDSDDIVEIDDKYYRKDDTDVVECEDGEYRMKCDCWKCEYSNAWYSDDEDGVDVEEGKYHPDSLREMADNA